MICEMQNGECEVWDVELECANMCNVHCAVCRVWNVKFRIGNV